MIQSKKHENLPNVFNINPKKVTLDLKCYSITYLQCKQLKVIKPEISERLTLQRILRRVSFQSESYVEKRIN